MFNKIKKIGSSLRAKRRSITPIAITPWRDIGFGRNNKGFTLVEVMIGMMILTVAIVSASNLLTGIIDSNRNNLTTLQAYYLSQEGLEMVRNIRDTNWLHNKDWLGGETVFGGKFEIPNSGTKGYVVKMVHADGTGSNASIDAPSGPNIQDVATASPWKIIAESPSEVGALYLHGKTTNSSSSSIDSNSENRDPDANFNFKRTILISDYPCKDLEENSNIPCPIDKTAYVLVQSKVTWAIGSKPRELTLSEVLSNWKGGAL